MKNDDRQKIYNAAVAATLAHGTPGYRDLNRRFRTLFFNAPIWVQIPVALRIIGWHWGQGRPLRQPPDNAA